MTVLWLCLAQCLAPGQQDLQWLGEKSGGKAVRFAVDSPYRVCKDQSHSTAGAHGSAKRSPASRELLEKPLVLSMKREVGRTHRLLPAVIRGGRQQSETGLVCSG